jgi:hypothetical protein
VLPGFTAYLSPDQCTDNSNSNARVQDLAGAGNFSLHHHVQTSSGVHPASYPMGNRGSFPGGKVASA